MEPTKASDVNKTGQTSVCSAHVWFSFYNHYNNTYPDKRQSHLQTVVSGYLPGSSVKKIYKFKK